MTSFSGKEQAVSFSGKERAVLWKNMTIASHPNIVLSKNFAPREKIRFIRTLKFDMSDDINKSSFGTVIEAYLYQIVLHLQKGEVFTHFVETKDLKIYLNKLHFLCFTSENLVCFT